MHSHTVSAWGGCGGGGDTIGGGGVGEPRTGIIYGHALRDPPPPPWSMVQDARPPVGWSVFLPSSPCGVVVGVLGFWV